MNRLKSLCCNTLYLTFDKNDSDLQYDVLQYTIALVKNTDIITLFQLQNFNVCKQSMIRLTTPFAKEKFWENKWKHHLSYYTTFIFMFLQDYESIRNRHLGHIHRYRRNLCATSEG